MVQLQLPAKQRPGIRLSPRDVEVLAFVGEQYCARADVLAQLLARHSEHPGARAAGAVSARVANRRVALWRTAGLVSTRPFLTATPSTLWLTQEGMGVAGLSYRATPPTFSTVAHRHATTLVRLDAEGRGAELAWTCERELREGLPGRRAHLPDGVVTSTDPLGRRWRSAIEVELTRKTQARVTEVLRLLLGAYDEVVYFAFPGPGAVVTRAAAGIGAGERVRVRPYPPPALARLA